VPAQKLSAVEEPEIRFSSKPTLSFSQVKIKSGFSLNEVNGNGHKESAPIIPEEQFTNNAEVTFEHITAAVHTYAEKKQLQGARQLSTTLKTSSIVFSNHVISLTINNETQREQLHAIRQDFLDELRKTLRNNQITLEISITRHETHTKAYKPTDIFKSMIEKNPALLELKKRFDLEIDY
jgi:DNA polymerase III subunit gamma/tau